MNADFEFHRFRELEDPVLAAHSSKVALAGAESHAKRKAKILLFVKAPAFETMLEPRIEPLLSQTRRDLDAEVVWCWVGIGDRSRSIPSEGPLLNIAAREIGEESTIEFAG